MARTPALPAVRRAGARPARVPGAVAPARSRPDRGRSAAQFSGAPAAALGMKPMLTRGELFQTALAETALRTGKLKHAPPKTGKLKHAPPKTGKLRRAPPNRLISSSAGNTMWFDKRVELLGGNSSCPTLSISLRTAICGFPLIAD